MALRKYITTFAILLVTTGIAICHQIKSKNKLKNEAKKLQKFKSRNGKCSLFYATMDGNLEICKLLLKYGAKVNIQNKYGNTSLIWATCEGHLEICKLLLKYGAYYRNNKGKFVYEYFPKIKEMTLETIQLKRKDLLEYFPKDICNLILEF